MENIERNGPTSPVMEKRTYTVQEVANILGISRNHAYEYIGKIGVRVIRIGATIRIPKTDFEEWFHGVGKTMVSRA